MPETGANALDEPGNAERFGVRAIVFRAEGVRVRPVVTGSAVGSRWWSVASDRWCVMWPAPVVARATSAFLPAAKDLDDAHGAAATGAWFAQGE